MTARALNSATSTRATSTSTETGTSTDLARLLPAARTDKAAAQTVLQSLRDNGAIRSFVEAEDPLANAERSLIANYAGDDELLKAMCAERLNIMCRDLAGENPTPLEKLLAERIALCWFHLHTCETLVAQQSAKMSLHQADFYQRQLDRAQNRYLAAIKALAQVRKLQLPNLQLNIGEKQVNIGQVGSE